MVATAAMLLQGMALSTHAAPQTFTNSIGMVMVWLPEGFWAGKFEVTQAEYETVTGRNPSRYKSPRNPVERVSWYDAMAFCEKLTEMEKTVGRLPDGHAYSLPTDRQWETMVADASLEDAVYDRFEEDQKPLGPIEVGSKPANSLGLHDIRGNVWEWCLELFLPRYHWRVLRGGGWSISDPAKMETTLRLNVEPDSAYDFYGFRCVLAPAAAP